MRAMQLSYETSELSMREVVSLLQRAISQDPGFARAYAALADAWHMLGVTGRGDYSAMVRNAEVAALKALELDSSLAEPHASMATVHSMLDRFDAALFETQEALRINPNLSRGYMSRGILDSIVRSSGEALTAFKRAYELDPLSPSAAEMVSDLAMWTGEEELARDVLFRLRELNPHEPKIYLDIADYYMSKRQFGEGEKAIDEARRVGPNEPMLVTSEALLFAFMGRRKESEEMLEKALSNGNELMRLNSKLWVRAALGDLDEVFEALMKLADMHAWPALIRIDPLYAKAREDPRYLQFCKKVGIPT